MWSRLRGRRTRPAGRGSRPRGGRARRQDAVGLVSAGAALVFLVAALVPRACGLGGIALAGSRASARCGASYLFGAARSSSSAPGSQGVVRASRSCSLRVRTHAGRSEGRSRRWRAGSRLPGPAWPLWFGRGRDRHRRLPGLSGPTHGASPSRPRRLGSGMGKLCRPPCSTGRFNVSVLVDDTCNVLSPGVLVSLIPLRFLFVMSDRWAPPGVQTCLPPIPDRCGAGASAQENHRFPRPRRGQHVSHVTGLMPNPILRPRVRR